MEASHPYKYKFFCWGYNKVATLDKWAKAHKVLPIVIESYADSKSDKPLMDLAKKQMWIDKSGNIK